VLSRREKLIGVDKEIVEYIEGRVASLCTLTQMAKPGGLRPGGVDGKWLKKHLSYLEERRIVFSQKMFDPVRNIRTRYFSLVPRERHEGHEGIEEYVTQRTGTYKRIVNDYYSDLEPFYLPLGHICCEMCQTEEFDKHTCPDILLLYQSWARNRYGERLSRWWTNKEVEMYKKKATIMKRDSTFRPPPFFLEDLTVTLINWTICEGPVILDKAVTIGCDDCKGTKTCREEGLKFLADILGDYLQRISDNDLKVFWGCVLQGIPDLKVDILNNYLRSRFGIEGFPGKILYVYEAGSLPYFYSVAIPRSFVSLVEQTIIPRIKQMSLLSEKYEKEIKSIREGS